MEMEENTQHVFLLQLASFFASLCFCNFIAKIIDKALLGGIFSLNTIWVFIL